MPKKKTIKEKERLTAINFIRNVQLYLLSGIELDVKYKNRWDLLNKYLSNMNLPKSTQNPTILYYDSKLDDDVWFTLSKEYKLIRCSHKLVKLELSIEDSYYITGNDILQIIKHIIIYLEIIGKNVNRNNYNIHLI